ncbi:sensor histidine kinase [Nonomuraea sp. NPDC049152]|uniref:sensor histidine kinase n=1 Tax=Nonomuraea sp. NPDC049152 TaxID=3154350 RepID=UPI0033DD1488
MQALLRFGVRLPSLTLDALPAAALFVATLGPGQVLQGQPRLLILQVGLLLPLIWRRRAPLAVFGAVAAVAFVQWLVGVQLPADVALLIALYTVAAHCDWRRTLLTGAVLEIGILLASARWAPHGQFVLSAIALTAMAAAAAATGTNLRTRRAYLASLQERALHLERERSQQAQLAVAEERTRIARDVHDIVTHNLSVMVALADVAVYTQNRSPDKTSAAIQQISGTGRQALTDMRRCLGVLRADEPDALRHPMPGIAQLESLADQIRATGLPTRLTLEGDCAPVPAAAQLTVYRLVQEALTNTLKHAPPGTHAEVRVRVSPEAVTIDVTDDGRTAQTAGPSSGHGIPGMRARAAAYGGKLHAGPRPGGGWRVSARLDLDTTADGAS